MASSDQRRDIGCAPPAVPRRAARRHQGDIPGEVTLAVLTGLLWAMVGFATTRYGDARTRLRQGLALPDDRE